MTNQATLSADELVAACAAQNKANIAAQDRALKAAILLTRENLTAAGKLTARTIARAEDTIAKAGLALMWRFKDEGEAYKATPCDYDKDIAPIALGVIAEAYAASSAGSQKTWRAYAKLFFLAGVHSLDTDETTISKIVDSFRDQLKTSGVIAEHGNDKAKRTPRPSTAKADKPSTATSSTDVVSSNEGQFDSHVDAMQSANPCSVLGDGTVVPVVPAEAPKFKPGKTYTDQDRRHAALILSGSPKAMVEIVKAFETHREQVLKFIHQLMESDAAK